MISGHATATGTSRFRARGTELAAEHFRKALGLIVSSIGLGTFPGADDEATDDSYSAAIARALELGCNVIDTAAPYRNQRSERMIGKTITKLISAGKILRDEIIISTKAGYIPFDSSHIGEIRQYFEETFLKPGLFSAADVVGGCHCLAPKFLRHQIEMSRQNLNCATIDIYFLHDPERQLQYLGREEFYARLLSAFEVLEQAVADRKISMYGTATWSGYRTVSESQDYLSLAAMMRCASEVGGEDHHFKAIMLPLNLAMPEAFTSRNQIIEGGNGMASPLQAAQECGLMVMASSSLHQGRLAHGSSLREFAHSGGSLATDAQRALQFARSVPGVTTALVGASNLAHMEEDLALSRISPLATGKFNEVYAGAFKDST